MNGGLECKGPFVEFMLAKEFEVVLVEALNYSRVVAFESPGLGFVGRRHLVSEDGVDGYVEPKALVIRSFGLNSFIESSISSSYALD
jgi:hypothetical protein